MFQVTLSILRSSSGNGWSAGYLTCKSSANWCFLWTDSKINLTSISSPCLTKLNFTRRLSLRLKLNRETFSLLNSSKTAWLRTPSVTVSLIRLKLMFYSSISPVSSRRTGTACSKQLMYLAFQNSNTRNSMRGLHWFYSPNRQKLVTHFTLVADCTKSSILLALGKVEEIYSCF